MATSIVTFVVSLLVLLWSAELLVTNAVSLARSFNISTMAIGLTVVSIGTSLPELASSVIAAYEGHSNIALGNVLGSNICNISLILALPAIFIPIMTSRQTLKKEGLIMLSISILFWLVALYLQAIPPYVAGLFLLLFIGFIFIVLNGAKNRIVEQDSLKTALSVKPTKPYSLVAYFCLALIALLVSSHFIVSSTIGIATALQIPESIIALTLIAFGTSIPELSVTFSAAKKGEGDILVGNILGSNITNILLVLGLSALVSPMQIEPQMLLFDFPAMVLTSLLMIYFLFGKSGLNRQKAIFLLIFYSGVILRAFIAT